MTLSSSQYLQPLPKRISIPIPHESRNPTAYSPSPPPPHPELIYKAPTKASAHPLHPSSPFPPHPKKKQEGLGTGAHLLNTASQQHAALVPDPLQH